MAMKRVSGKWVGLISSLVVSGLCFCISSQSWAEPLSHKVEKGDTLWSISEKYFGNPAVWPKLWEMNPFVTNPHLLRPGDMIRLGEKESISRSIEEKATLPAEVPVQKPETKMSGIAVGALTKMSACGFLSPQEETPWGYVLTSESDKLLLTKGDNLFLDFAGREEVKTGDEFMIFRLLSHVTHVITEKHAGYLYSSRAKVILRERSKQRIFRAEIEENYGDVVLGDLVFPATALSPCLAPLSTDTGLRGVVVAVEGRQTIFGQMSVVFLDSGRDKGLRAGSMLDLVRIKNMPDVPLDSLGTLVREFLRANTLAEMIERLRKESPLYEKVAGRMIVLDSGPETATALVLSTNENLQVGSFFRGLSVADPSPSLESLLTCPAE